MTKLQTLISMNSGKDIFFPTVPSITYQITEQGIEQIRNIERSLLGILDVFGIEFDSEQLREIIKNHESGNYRERGPISENMLNIILLEITENNRVDLNTNLEHLPENHETINELLDNEYIQLSSNNTLFSLLIEHIDTGTNSTSGRNTPSKVAIVIMELVSALTYDPGFKHSLTEVLSDMDNLEEYLSDGIYTPEFIYKLGHEYYNTYSEVMESVQN